MKLFDFKSIFGRKTEMQKDISANGLIYPAGTATLSNLIYDGEQDLDGIGNNVIYDVDYYTMAKRAYTLATVNEFVRIAVSRLAQFAVGTGLKLHPEPAKNFLKRKFKIDLPETFAKEIQELWTLFEDDENVSIDKRDNIHSLARQVFYNAYIAGDILIIKRIKHGCLNYQLVNGLSVQSARQKADNGNKIINGVEINDDGEHIAYYVVDDEGKEQRITARDSNGRLVAWLCYADDKRLNSVRGYSPLGAIMQKLQKIGSYSNAEIIAANTNAKFAAVIEQDKDSSGVNPLKGLPAARGLREIASNIPTSPTNQGEIEHFKNNLKRVSSGIFFHMPKGQKMSSFDTKRPNVNYGQFVDSSMKYNYASLGIPHEVALLVFQNNFSASRASLKMFEMVLKYLRKYIIIDGFYMPVYKQFFELECLKNNINAPLYLKLKNDYGYLDNAYTKCKFIGSQIPHIDETKEVNAVLSKIKGGLTTFEQALESLGNTTDFDSLIERRKLEQEKIDSANLTFETIMSPDVVIDNGDE